ncbi:MAG: hypothetical protein EBT09_00265 [Actinobacteria bacterium]|nr:hypothetical protein [Actinomycetota bacterium]
MTSPEALTVPLFDGRFRLDRVIGEGMSGRVVLATDLRAPAGSQLCVVKTAAASIHARAEINAEREALSLLMARGTEPSRIAPRHIADGTDQGIPFIAMEHIGAPYISCDQLAAEAGTMLEGDILQLWHALASLLEVAHDFGFLHNDIGPNKLNHLWWITDPEPGTSHLARLKVIDWGNCVWPNRVGNQSSRTFKGELQATASAIFTITTGRPPTEQRNLPVGWTRNDRKFLSGAFVALIEEILADGPDGKIVSATALRERIEALETFRDAQARDQARVVTDARLHEIASTCGSWTREWSQLTHDRLSGFERVQPDALPNLARRHPLRAEAVLPREYEKLVANFQFEERDRLWLGLDGADQSGAVLLGTSRLEILGAAFNALPQTRGLPGDTAEWLQKVPTAEGNQAEDLITRALLPPTRADVLLDNGTPAKREASQLVLASLIERAGMPRNGPLDRLIASSVRVLRTSEPGFVVPTRPPVSPMGKDTPDSHAGAEWLVDLDRLAPATLMARVAEVRNWYVETRTSIEDASNRGVSPERHRPLLDNLASLHKALSGIHDLLKSDGKSPVVTDAFEVWVRTDPPCAPLVRAANWAISERPKPTLLKNIVAMGKETVVAVTRDFTSAVDRATNRGSQSATGHSQPEGSPPARGGTPVGFEVQARQLENLTITRISNLDHAATLLEEYSNIEMPLLNAISSPSVPVPRKLKLLQNIILFHNIFCKYSIEKMSHTRRAIASESNPFRKQSTIKDHVDSIRRHATLIQRVSATVTQTTALLGNVRPADRNDLETHSALGKKLTELTKSLHDATALSTELKGFVVTVSNR